MCLCNLPYQVIFSTLIELLNYFVWELFAYFIQKPLNFSYKNIHKQSIPWMSFRFFTRLSRVQLIFFLTYGYWSNPQQNVLPWVIQPCILAEWDRKPLLWWWFSSEYAHLTEKMPHIMWTECACTTMDYFQCIHFNFI